MEAKISGREREVLFLASQGFTDKAIAAQLALSVRTVGTYWERLRVKTAGKSRSHIIMEILGKELEIALREAQEARLERDILLEQAEGYAVFSVGLDEKILDWNPGVLRVLGFEREEFVGKHFSLVFTPDDVRLCVPDLELDNARRHGRFIEQRFHIRKDGSQVWIDGTVVAISDEAGQVRKYSKIMRDDSERKSLEEEVQRLQSIER